MRGDGARPDDGYVLASVIGMMTVLLLVVPMVLAATMSTTGWATAQRASVQARAAAEAGIDIARAAFAAGGSWCGVGGTLSSSFTDPSYDVTVYSSSSGPATASGSPTCPTTGVRADDADLTEEFVEGDWREVVYAALAPGHSVSDLCHLTGAGSAFAGPVVIAQATRFDTRAACPTGISLGLGLRLDLGADAVLVADGITQTGDVEITASGASQHSLYLVDPWPDDPTATCDPLSTANGIDLAYGTWDQGPGAAVLLSTHRGARIASSPTGLAGQVDACTVDLPVAASLTHASVSDSAAIDVSGFAVWDLAYVRDRS
ncbi:hypothetical protein [Cellulomonas triticagri]|uniref:Uncharacterized protein n=1 Tax=Cellulomonas triticagri TaxID=2483352 RepID=A0A3M2JMM2_9CELL|nr:hypothetical protein [Cellulomonas triticagri]RMI12843.1 hypothetical protein EBM89_07000 [Cellulomonas triticagri]